MAEQGVAQLAISNLIQAPPPKVNVPKKQFPVYLCAHMYLQNMDETQRSKLKAMLENGAHIGRGIANAYNVQAEALEDEIKIIIREEYING